MYVYIRSEPSLWTVGDYWGNDKFEPRSDHDSPKEAAEETAQLNASQYDGTSFEVLQTEPRLWTVGFYKPSGKFEPESDHDSPTEAKRHASWLNGN
jgi:hypothetical protein